MFKIISTCIILIGLQFMFFNTDKKLYAYDAAPYPILEAVFIKQDMQILTISAYTPDPKENWGNTSATAFGTELTKGTVAVSQDLYKKGWKKGKKIRIVGHGVFKINDLMHKRHRKKIDILLMSKKKAKKFGVQKAKVILLSDVGEEN